MGVWAPGPQGCYRELKGWGLGDPPLPLTELERGHWVRSRVWGQEQGLEAGGLEQFAAFSVSISLSRQSTCGSFVVNVAVYSQDAGPAH